MGVAVATSGEQSEQSQLVTPVVCLCRLSPYDSRASVPAANDPAALSAPSLPATELCFLAHGIWVFSSCPMRR